MRTQLVNIAMDYRIAERDLELVEDELVRLERLRSKLRERLVSQMKELGFRAVVVDFVCYRLEPLSGSDGFSMFVVDRVLQSGDKGG